MASMYRPTRTRKDGTKYKCKTWYCKYFDASGVRRTKSLSQYKNIAQGMMRNLVMTVEREKAGFIDREDVRSLQPIEKHASEYEQHLKVSQTAARYRFQVMMQIRAIIKDCGFVNLNEIDGDPVEAFLHALTETGRSAKTRNDYLGSLRAFVNWCIKTRRMKTDPLRQVARMNVKEDRRRRRRALTPQEAEALISVAMRRPVERSKHVAYAGGRFLDDEDRRIMGQKHALTWKLMMLTGIRKGEVAGLTWADVDLDQGWMTIPAKIAKSGEDRMIPLSEPLVEDLNQWKRASEPASSETSVIEIPDDLVRVLKTDLKFAGINYRDDAGRVVDCHSLRHTAATWLNSAGLPTKVIQMFMGHASAELSTETYVDRKLIDVRPAASALPELPVIKNSGQQSGLQKAS